jgi:hypothetical protein
MIIFFMKILGDRCEGFGTRGEVVGMKFIDFCLEKNRKTIICAMYSERQSNYLKTNYDD